MGIGRAGAVQTMPGLLRRQSSLECAAAARALAALGLYFGRRADSKPRPSVDDTLACLKRQPFYLVATIDTEGRGASKIPVTAARLILGGRLAPLASLRISSLQHSGASSLARGARQIAVQKTVHNTVHS